MSVSYIQWILETESFFNTVLKFVFLCLQYVHSVESWDVIQILWLRLWKLALLEEGVKRVLMLATAAPCGPTHSAPSERPEHAVETWRTTLPCRVSRTCSSKIVAPKQAPQLSRGPCPCPRPLSQGTYASMRRGLYRGRAGPQSTCTAGCLGTLISAPLMKSSRRVLCRAPGLS